MDTERTVLSHQSTTPLAAPAQPPIETWHPLGSDRDRSNRGAGELVHAAVGGRLACFDRIDRKRDHHPCLLGELRPGAPGAFLGNGART